MANINKVISKQIKICNKRGLHARAAAKFVNLAEKFNAEILVIKGDNKACGISIMGLMMLAASNGMEIEIETSGIDAVIAMEQLCNLVNNKFNEDC